MSDDPFFPPPANVPESPNKRASSCNSSFPTTGTPEKGIKTTPKRPASAISRASSQISQDSESSSPKRLASASSLSPAVSPLDHTAAQPEPCFSQKMSEDSSFLQPANIPESPNKRASSCIPRFPTTVTPEKQIKITPKRPASAISRASSQISQDSESSSPKRLASASSLSPAAGPSDHTAAEPETYFYHKMMEDSSFLPPANIPESPNKRASSCISSFPLTGTSEKGIKTTPKMPASAISRTSSQIQDLASSSPKRLDSASSLFPAVGVHIVDAVRRSDSAANRQLVIRMDEMDMDQSDSVFIAHSATELSQELTMLSKQSPQDRITELQAGDSRLSSPDATMEDITCTPWKKSRSGMSMHRRVNAQMHRRRLVPISPQKYAINSLHRAERLWQLLLHLIPSEFSDEGILQEVLDEEEHNYILEEIAAQYPKLWTVQLKVAQFSVYTQWTTLIGDNLLPEEATYTALEDEGLNFKKIKNGMFEDRNGKILPDVEMLHDVMICLPCVHKLNQASFDEILAIFSRHKVVGKANVNDLDSTYSFEIFGPNIFSRKYIKKLDPELSEKLQRLENKYLLAFIFTKTIELGF